MIRTFLLTNLIAGFAVLVFVTNSYGQANLPIYTNHLVNGFQNASWATVNLANKSPVYTNADSYTNTASISVTDGPNYQALALERAAFNTSPYSSLDFEINGGSSGGQKLWVTGLLNGTNQNDYSLGILQ